VKPSDEQGPLIAICWARHSYQLGAIVAANRANAVVLSWHQSRSGRCARARCATIGAGVDDFLHTFFDWRQSLGTDVLTTIMR
jgi:hypothetical protein